MHEVGEYHAFVVFHFWRISQDIVGPFDNLGIDQGHHEEADPSLMDIIKTQTFLEIDFAHICGLCLFTDFLLHWIKSAFSFLTVILNGVDSFKNGL